VKVGLIVAGAVLSLWVIAAVGFYMFAMPNRLASDYRDDAEPEHKQIRKAMQPVYKSLSIKTFYLDDRRIEKAKTPDRFVHEIDRATSKALRRLQPLERKVARARKTLEKADEKALTDVPDWPMLGGRDDLEVAEEIAEDEERYLPEARAFLKRYEDLVEFWISDALALRRFGVTVGRGFESVPDNPTSPGQVTGPLERMARKLDKHLRSYKRSKPPPGLRRYRKEAVALVRLFTREIRGLADAVKDRDLARIESFDNRIDRAIKKSKAEVSVGHLVYRSNYAQDIRRLKSRERKLQREFRKL
jgi:hypothetical protein